MTFVAVAQSGLERLAFNQVAGGSNPPRDTRELSIMDYTVFFLQRCRVQVPQVPLSSIAQQAEHPAVNR